MASSTARGFRIGSKQIFLPDHIVTLCRPHRPLPPQFATFQVPLTFNKFDIRDYLLHAYGVSSVSVRSHIAQRPPRVSPFTGRVGRPPPIKYMTVELEKPFVWPAEPTEKETEQWHSEEMKKRIDMEKRFEASREHLVKKGNLSSPAHSKRSEDRRLLEKQARDILSGKVKWDNKRELDPRWGEKDQSLP
ncbi:hypothetical protein BX600DRAFT_445346 [Xylariales sp. PMI_506]|nr:hypothetical protein BX600DRAFT_445346 [Xylariales sp. PMI_506]